jgi:predicted ATPase
MPNERLTRVRVRGYRCLADASFEPAGRGVTVVVGGNGSGKSSLLDAVGLVGDLLRVGGAAFRRELRGNANDQSDAFRFLVSSFGSGEIEIALDFQVRGTEYHYAIALAARESYWAIARETLRGPAQTGEGEPEVLLDRDATGARVRRSDGAGAIKLVPVLAEQQVPTVTLGADRISYPELEVPRRFLRGLCFLRPTPVLMRGGGGGVGEFPLPYGQDATARMVRLANEVPEHRSDFLRFMGEFVGWTKFRTPGASRVEFNEGTHPSPIAFESASDGTVVEAWLLALALDPPEAVTVLLLDEPVAQFYRRSIQRPAELLKTLATQRQLLVATHAATLVAEVGSEDTVWVVTRRPGEGGTVRRLRDLPGSDEDVLALGLGDAAELRAEELPQP